MIKRKQKKNSPTMAVKILHGKLNIKQDEHTKIGDQFGEWSVNNSCSISGPFVLLMLKKTGDESRMIKNIIIL